MSLTRRGYLVTGATGALGEAVVTALLAERALVVLPYRDEAAFERLVSRVGDGLIGVRADVSQRADATALVDAALARLGRVDGLACLAGGWAGGQALHEAPEEQWNAMLLANLESAYGVCRALLPHLCAGASIVTVGARAVDTGGAGAAAYAVSKAAVHALTRALAAENRARGVRVNCVAPNVIDTPANRAAMPNADTASWTTPAAIARVIVFLLSPFSEATSGAIVPV